MLSFLTSLILRETGGVQRWMRNIFFFKECQRTRRRPEAPNWQHKDGDRQRVPILALGQYTFPFSRCENEELLQSSLWNDIDSAWFAGTNHMAKEPGLCIPPTPFFRPLFQFPEILSPPVWQLLQLHVHLTQKDPANMLLPQFDRSRFLGSWAALIYLEDSLLI